MKDKRFTNFRRSFNNILIHFGAEINQDGNIDEYLYGNHLTELIKSYFNTLKALQNKLDSLERYLKIHYKTNDSTLPKYVKNKK